MLDIRNLTPHTLNITMADGEVLVVPPSGIVARVSVSDTLREVLGGIEIFDSPYVEGLPARVDGQILVVSGLAKTATAQSNVFSPGDLIRDAEGRPIGCRGLKG